MDDIISKIRSRRNVKESTLKIYKSNLGKAFRTIDGSGETNLDFLSDTDKVMDYLKELKPATKRTYLATFIVSLEALESDKETLDFYRKHLKETQTIVDKSYEEGQMTDRQKDNWVTMAKLQQITRGLYKELKEDRAFERTELTPKQHQDLQDHLIATLYTMGDSENPPPRLDYANMKVIKKDTFDQLKPDEKDKHNFLIISKKDMAFNFNDFKTINSHGSTTIKVGKRLKPTIIRFLKHIPENGFLLTYKDKPMTSQMLGLTITRIFSRTNRKITSSLIRNIYLTEKFPREQIKEQEDIAQKMMSSVDVQEKVYRKDLEN